jgi:hypothetical protein
MPDWGMTYLHLAHAFFGNLEFGRKTAAGTFESAANRSKNKAAFAGIGRLIRSRTGEETRTSWKLVLQRRRADLTFEKDLQNKKCGKLRIASWLALTD